MNDQVREGVEWLKARPERAWSVREIEETLKFPPNTLARAFNRLVLAGKGGIKRAPATYRDSKHEYRGFQWSGEDRGDD